MTDSPLDALEGGQKWWLFGLEIPSLIDLPLFKSSDADRRIALDKAIAWLKDNELQARYRGQVWRISKVGPAGSARDAVQFELSRTVRIKSLYDLQPDGLRAVNRPVRGTRVVMLLDTKVIAVEYHAQIAMAPSGPAHAMTELFGQALNRANTGHYAKCTPKMTKSAFSNWLATLRTLTSLKLIYAGPNSPAQPWIEGMKERLTPIQVETGSQEVEITLRKPKLKPDQEAACNDVAEVGSMELEARGIGKNGSKQSFSSSSETHADLAMLQPELPAENVAEALRKRA